MYFEDQTAVANGRSYAQELLLDPLEDFLTSRATHVSRPDAPLTDTCSLLGRDPHSALLIVAHEVVIGIVSQSDVVRSVAQGLDPNTTPVSKIMTRHPFSVDVTASVGDALTIMVRETVNTLPVLDAGQVAGILAYRDIPSQYHWAHDLLDFDGTLATTAVAQAS